MKKLSTALLATTLAVSMVSPVSVMAKANPFEEIAKEAKKVEEKVEEKAEDAKKDVKEEAKKAEEKAEDAKKDVKEEAKKVEEKAEDVKKDVKEEVKKEEEKKEAKEEAKEEKKEEAKKDVKAVASPQKVTLDGKEVKIHGYNIEGSNYFKLRDLAAVLKDTEAKFAVDYKAPEKDQKTGEIILEPGKEYKVLDTDLQEIKAEAAASDSNDKVKVGEKDLEAKAYKIDGSNYYNLRDLAKELKFGVEYDKETNTVVLTSKEAKETVKEEVEKVDEKLKENGKEEAKEIEKQAEKTDKQNLTENTVK